MAHKGLQVRPVRSDIFSFFFFLFFKPHLFFSPRRQDYLSASSDLQEVLQLDPNVREAEQELEAVTCLLRQSLMENGDEDAPEVKPRGRTLANP